MQVIQAIFGCIGVIFMILGALLMMRKSPRLNEVFDAAAQARGCESEHQAVSYTHLDVYKRQIQHAVEIGGGDFLDCCHGKLLYTTPAWAGWMFTRFAYTQRRGVGSGDVEVDLSPWRWCAAR